LDAEHYIALGKMEATVKALTDDVADIKADQKASMAEVKETLAGQDEKLDLLLKLHHQRRGAVRLGKGIIALITSSGFAGWLWEHLHR
jgi:hypothetical protein